MKDFYYILGTDVNCTSNELREAYLKLSKKFHPDLNQDDHYFESRFREVREAYETLSDPASRSQYDAALKKFKTYPAAEAPKKQPRPFKTKSIDIAFTIILLVITLIFGNYVFKSMRGTKAVTVSKAPAIITHKISYHKKRHKIKPIPATIVADNKPIAAIANNRPVKVMTDSTKARPVKPAPVINNKPVVNNNVKTENKPLIAPVNYRRATNNTNSSYTTYIKSNVTGVVYLRRSDNYHSDVVTAIPTNSEITVLEKGSTFCKVLFNNKTGYVPNRTVQTK